MVLAKEQAIEERRLAEKASTFASMAEARAKEARIASARQQLIIAERMAVLDAAKEAAEVGERMSQIARSTAVAERLAADNARKAAEQAKREAATEQAFVRDIFRTATQPSAWLCGDGESLRGNSRSKKWPNTISSIAN